MTLAFTVLTGCSSSQPAENTSKEAETKAEQVESEQTGAAETSIGLLKDTSLAANITVTEMFMVTQRIAAKTYEPLALYCEVALIYLLFCTILTMLQSWGEKKLKAGQGEK